MKIKERRKEEILKWLEQFGRLPTSKFVGLMSVEYNQIISLLEELESEGKVVSEKETRATYWRLKQ